jgi:predicted nuclease of predicted toxin-antitoxin system
MKFKIDQNLPVEAAELLSAAGHDAMTVYQQTLGGASDERIVDVCKNEGRILITADLDLSDIRHYPPTKTPGYIVLRLPRQSKQALLDLLAKIIPVLATRPINGQLWIVEPERLRIRGGE